MAERTEIAAKYNTVVINGQTTAVSKNPRYMPGGAPVKVYTATVGDTIYYVHDPDYQEVGGQLTISLRNTASNQDLAIEMQSKVADNSVHTLDVRSGSARVFAKLSVTEQLDFSNEEEFDIVLKGEELF